MKGNIKKDFFNYFISIIIPGCINFFSIPIIKKLIGTENYGEYTLWYNAFFIIIAASASWLGMYIVRFKAEHADSESFFKNAYRLVKITNIGIFSIVFLSSLIVSHQILFSLIYATAMILCVTQNSLHAVSQSSFNSKAIVISETIRVSTFFIVYLILLNFSTTHYLEKLFFSLLISYVSSITVLYKRNNLQFLKNKIDIKSIPLEYKTALKFGVPLTIWFLITSSIPFLDKILLVNKFGLRVQGDYQSVFDLIFRSVTIVFNPLNTAIFPYLTKAYAEKNVNLIKKIIGRALLIQFGLLIIGLIAYSLGIWKILFNLLNIHDYENYFYVGSLLIAASFIWQMAMTIHKPFELMKKTNLLLVYNIISFILTILPLLYIYYNDISFRYYPIGVLVGGLVYNLLCIIKISRLNKSSFIND